MQSAFDTAKSLFLEGVRLLEAGRAAEAEQQLLASLQHLPGRASTLVNLGLARLALGRPADALAALDEALAAEPVAPDVACHRAAALGQLGRLEDAAAQLQALLQREPAFGAAWALLGHVQKDRGRPAEARAAFEQAVAQGADTPANRYALAALGGGAVPAATPPEYVQALFDGYADDFDTHLVGTLRYRAHEAVVQAAAAGAPFASVLDLGCGTGLCAPGLRPLARRLVGMDLSATMVERARARGLYDEVLQAELLQHLQQTPERHDLVTAADVLLYFGDLAPVFEGVHRVLQAGGRFVLSVEAGPPDEAFVLQPNLRYAHGERALQALAAARGFALRELQPMSLREEQRRPIPGLVAVLSKEIT